MSYLLSLAFYRQEPVTASEEECIKTLSFLTPARDLAIKVDSLMVKYPNGTSLQFESAHGLLTFLAREHHWSTCWFLQEAKKLVLDEAKGGHWIFGVVAPTDLDTAARRIYTAYMIYPETQATLQSHFDEETRQRAVTLG